MMDLVYNIIVDGTKENETFKCEAMSGDTQMCECTMYTDTSHKVWTISSWFTKNGYGNHGYGTLTMRRLVEEFYYRFGKPEKVEYIWNGSNQYVFEWMERNFDAECQCPLVILKTCPDDDWLSHIYELNIDKFMKYFLKGDKDD